jgi:hypothetical protein
MSTYALKSKKTGNLAKFDFCNGYIKLVDSMNDENNHDLVGVWLTEYKSDADSYCYGYKGKQEYMSIYDPFNPYHDVSDYWEVVKISYNIIGE